MLPKKNRLKKKKDIEAALKRKKKDSFSLLLYCFKSQGPSRFAFSVPKKVAKKATQRNKIKRRLREIFHQEILKIIPEGLDCLVVAKKEILDKKYQELKQEIINLFK